MYFSEEKINVDNSPASLDELGTRAIRTSEFKEVKKHKSEVQENIRQANLKTYIERGWAFEPPCKK